MDNNGDILKHINFSKIDSKLINPIFILIDSIHNILLNRKISSRKLELDLRFNRNRQAVFYYARTFIRGRSIAGPTCSAEYQEHFKVNALTGEIIEFNNENWMEYHDN